MRARALFFLSTALSTGTGDSWAQDPSGYFNLEDFSSEALYATRDPGTGGRAMGMAGVFVAVADDATALATNPAGLAQLVRPEFAFGVQTLRDQSTHGMFGTQVEARTPSSTIDHVAIAGPLPTYRGSFVLAGGVFRARSNDLETRRADRRVVPGRTYNDDFERTQGGGLYRWTGGFAVDLLRDLSFGMSLSYWEGSLEDEQFRSIDESDLPRSTDLLVTEADVDGFGFDLGLLGYLGNWGRLGFVLRSPLWFDVTGGGELVHSDAGGTTSELLYIDDHPRLPWSVAGGLTLGPRWLLCTGEVRYTSWEEIEGVPLSGPRAKDYESQLGAGVAVELHTPGLPLRLRAGFAHDPVPYQLHLGNPAYQARERRRYAVGAGLLVDGRFALDAALVRAEFERADVVYGQVFEERVEEQAHLSAAYRF